MSGSEVTTLAELDQLDIKQMVAGYRAGHSQDPDYSMRDKAYWHGFLNGLVDSGKSQPSEAQGKLARAYVERGR